MNKWKGKTCKKCVFREGVECRRFPPAIASSYQTNSVYQKVANGYIQSACAEYKEDV